ncbi:MAG: arsenate reductase (glutaredoxin) [Bacteroidales bacterium]|jgi:arsenate reductase (glutaredoxin)|nr:arsenate reductase (glutaredoxin) [Bacteroidales bacterium]
MIKIYHNPRCSKSREGLSFLSETTQDFEIAEYLKNGISTKNIQEITSKMNCSAEEIIRRQEPDFKDFYKGKKLSEEEWIQAIVNHPKLLQRPIIVTEKSAIIARPANVMTKII